VPLSFKPERLNVEVSSGRRDVAPLSQTFLWSVEASPEPLDSKALSEPSCSTAIPGRPASIR